MDEEIYEQIEPQEIRVQMLFDLEGYKLEEQQRKQTRDKLNKEFAEIVVDWAKNLSKDWGNEDD